MVCIFSFFTENRVHCGLLPHKLTELDEENNRNLPPIFYPNNDGHNSSRSSKDISMLTGNREAVPLVLFVVMSVHHGAE